MFLTFGCLVAFCYSDLGYEDTDQDDRKSTNGNVDQGEPVSAAEGAAGGKVGKSNGVVSKPSKEREALVRTGGATAQVRKQTVSAY